MISNGIILGRNVYAMSIFFSVIYLLKMMRRLILLGFVFLVFCFCFCFCLVSHILGAAAQKASSK